MKQQLTKEQSQRLIELGVPTEKASSSVVEEMQGNGGSWTYPVFTIGDLLEVLPKEIYNRNDRNIYSLNIRYSFPCYEVSFYNMQVAHSLLPIIHKDELIDALFDLVLWCIDGGYIKTDKL